MSFGLFSFFKKVCAASTKLCLLLWVIETIVKRSSKKTFSSKKLCTNTKIPNSSLIFFVADLSAFWTTGKMSRKRKLDGDSPDVPSIAESWSRTEQYTVKGRHQWTIDNFLHRAQFTEVGDSLCSPIFGVPVEVIGSPKPSELLFQLEVFPNGKITNWIPV